MPTVVTNSKDESESLSTNFLLDPLSDVPIEALILLAVIVLCILVVSIVIVWISCRLCARDSNHLKGSTPSTSVYQWNTLTSKREYTLTVVVVVVVRLIERTNK